MLIVPSIGTLLFFLSTWGDLVGFWSNKPFLTNMVSALIGALYGVPFALVILQRLARTQAARLERDAARRLGERAGEELVAAAVVSLRGAAPACGSTGDGYDDLAMQTRRVLDALVETIERVDVVDEVRGAVRFSDQYLLSVESAEQFLSVLNDAVDVWVKILGDEDRISSRLLQARASWEFLAGPVRTRILEAGFSWVDASLAEDCRKSLDELQRLMPSGYLPRAATATRAEFRSYTSHRRVLTYGSPGDEGVVSLPHSVVIAISDRLDRCLGFVAELQQLAHRSRKMATLLTN